MTPKMQNITNFTFEKSHASSPRSGIRTHRRSGYHVIVLEFSANFDVQSEYVPLGPMSTKMEPCSRVDRI
jgi:hypothetical protein